MITIDAAGTDGRNILPDLDGCSPGGGHVTTERRGRTELRPGDVLRDVDSAWSVVVGLAHNGRTGITTVALVAADGFTDRRTLAGCAGAEVRTDVRIDQDTLYKLPDIARPTGHVTGG